MDTPATSNLPSAAAMSPEQLQADLQTMRSVLEQSTASKGPHRVIIAGANLFFGIMFLLAVPVIVMVFSIPMFTAPHEEGIVAVPIVGGAIIAILVFLSLPFLLAGWGLLKGKRWGEAAAVVAAVFNVWNVPLGTALTIYTFWAMANGKLKAEPAS
jgi:hypothetical protein